MDVHDTEVDDTIPPLQPERPLSVLDGDAGDEGRYFALPAFLQRSLDLGYLNLVLGNLWAGRAG